eukprot:3063379-Pleurochrysis_carterae.AAC.1
MPPPLPRSTRSPCRRQPTSALPASDSRSAPNASAVDAGFAVPEVVCVLVGLEEQRLQLQHVRRRLGRESAKPVLPKSLCF